MFKSPQRVVLCFITGLFTHASACEDVWWRQLRVKVLQIRGRPVNNHVAPNYIKEVNGFARTVLVPGKGFDCAVGSASLSLLLSDLHSLAGDNLRALRYAQMASVFAAYVLQSDGKQKLDDSSWPITWQATIDHSLQGMMWLNSLDMNRNASMSELLERKKVVGTPVKVGIVSICDYDPSVTQLAVISKINKQAYADKYGFKLIFHDKAPHYEDYFSLRGDLDPSIPHAWRKIDALLIAMAEQEYHFDWFMWMDCDSFFMDQETSLGYALDLFRNISQRQSYGDRLATKQNIQSLKSWVPHRKSTLMEELQSYRDIANKLQREEAEQVPDGVHVVASEDGLMLNTGIMFLRNSVMSFNLLWEVRALLFGRSRITHHSWWEQAALMFILVGPSLADDLEWERGKQNRGFPDYMRLFSQKQVNGYPPLIAGMLQSHSMFEYGDFIVSFSGCKTYTSQKVCNYLMADYFRNACTTKDCLTVLNLIS
jgi:hypothetical protein